MRDMFLFMCFTGLSYGLESHNIRYPHRLRRWYMAYGQPYKTGVAYVVKLLPIAIELIENRGY